MQRTTVDTNGLRVAYPWLAGIIPPNEPGTAHVVELTAGEILMHPGQESVPFYLVLEGRLAVLRHYPDGREIVPAIIEQPGFCGEIESLERVRCCHTVRVIAPSRLLAVRPSDFEAWLTHAPFAVFLLRGQTRRLWQASERAVAQAFASSENRLASVVLSYEGGAPSSRVGLSQDELAAMAGCSTRSVSRVVKAWKREGLVEAAYHKVILRNPEKLRRKLPRNSDFESENQT